MSDQSSSAPATRDRTGGYRLPDGRVPVLISSDAAELVAAEASAVRDYVRAHPDVNVSAIGAHLLRTRPARRHRALVAATDPAQLAEALDALAGGRPHPAVTRGSGPATPRRIAYTFPGQGSQRPGMGRRLHDLSQDYRRMVDGCHDQSMRLFGSSPRDYVLGDIDADDPAVRDVRVIQPALFMHMAGLAAMWDAAGASPAMTVGHSQGEIAAAHRSRAMTLSDALTIVTVRARLVHELSPRGHTMAVVGIDIDECESMLARHSGWAQLSVVNSAHILCISGRREAVLEMVETLTAAGKFAREIRVEYPAHTSVVSEYQPAFLDALGTYLEHDHMLPGDLPCIGATLGEAVDESMSLGDYWFWNLRNRVRFDKAVTDAALRHRADFFIEMSDHPTLLLALGETLTGVDDAGLGARTVIGTSRRDAAGLEEFTRNVATLAVADSGFRWDALAADTSVSTAASSPILDGFPNTVMRRVHLWANRDAGLDDPVNSPRWGAAQAMSRAGGEVRRLVAGWQPLKRRDLLAPRTIAILDPTGECRGLGAEICAAAAEQGARAVLVDDDTRTDTAIDLTDVDTAVLLTGPTGTKPDGFAEAVARVLADGRWRAGLPSLPEQFWWVTVGGEHVRADDLVPDLVHGSITAALRCAGTEYPGTRFRHLDLSPVPGVPMGSQVVSAVHVGGEPELALRDGGLHVKRLMPAPVTGTSDEADRRHVLITGGTGKLGVEICAHHAAAGARRITLLSRSGGSAATVRRIDGLRRRHGTDISIIRCDITDDAAIAEFVATRPDPVTLLVHTAMNYVPVALDRITAEQIADAQRAKVSGVRRLLAGIDCADDVRVVLCSSVAATLGGREQALYALTNRALDIVAAELRADGVCANAIEWGLWRVQGPLDAAGVARVEGAGMIPMAPAAAMTAGFAVPGEDAVVMSADWAELRDLLALFGYDRVLGSVPDDAALGFGTVAETAATPHVDEPVVGQPEFESPAQPPVTDAGAPPAGLDAMLRTELAVTMGLDTGEIDLDPDVPLVALGLDSLQALDFRKRVKTELGQDLPVEAILGGASLREVTALMTGR